jgi:hypothetical protein
MMLVKVIKAHEPSRREKRSARIESYRSILYFGTFPIDSLSFVDISVDKHAAKPSFEITMVHNLEKWKERFIRVFQ